MCRIFQKSGSGPQNGAQYGAPFVEEEWAEEAEDFLFKTEEVSTCAGGGGQEYVQTNDFEEEVKFCHIYIMLSLRERLKTYSL